MSHTMKNVLAVVTLIVIISIGYFLFNNYQQKQAVEKANTTATQVEKAGVEIANPFSTTNPLNSVETNPINKIKTNPFE